ncbi:MAG: hypothetical protein COB83_07850 [Gammaproteobacteria bacterium]|nr:MAG: hypothetical protein COB83_07850 [Gammaproteobacteria bacterium]
MKTKKNIFNLAKFMMRIAALMSILAWFSSVVSAEENDYQIDKIVQLNHGQVKATNWHQLITNPSNKQQYFITSNTGQVYLVDDSNKTHTVLDLSVNQPQEQSPVKLTAMVLHPNFSLRDQLGYGTFYTAHLEVLNKNIRTKRLQERGKELTLKFDAVITEWQFSSNTYQQVDLRTKREVLRIAVPDNSMSIKQMSFSPYIKSWNDNFGLLYIALNGQKKWQKPLYSGVILRINPAKFGLRSFTVPMNNPYLQDAQIKDEIYLLGGQQIQQFIWPDKNGDDILLSHQYENKRLLSLVSGRNDWRERAPKKIIYQSDSMINDILSYRGRELPSLRNRLLLLRKKNQHWLVESLSIKATVDQNTPIENKPQHEWQFNAQQLTDDSDINFSTRRYGEVLVLDKTAGMIFQVSQENIDAQDFAMKNVDSNDNQSDTNNGYFTYLVFLIVIGIVFYWFKRNRFSAKSVVRKQFAHIELSESQLQVGLYYRHQKSTETIIDIADIVSCEVRLNEQTINLINQQAGHGFNHDIEQDLRNVLTKAQVDKMVDGRIRQVSLLLKSSNEKHYTICLYMRKGSDRITKKTYSVVINDVIDWCWLMAEKINASETGKRKKKPTTPVTIVNTIEQSQQQTSLHRQAAAIRTVTHELEKSPENKEKDQKQNASKEQPIKWQVSAAEKASRTPPSNTINTGLVNALEKLVELKQQGFLTQEEFTKAKENLMQSLFDK